MSWCALPHRSPSARSGCTTGTSISWRTMKCWRSCGRWRTRVDPGVRRDDVSIDEEIRDEVLRPRLHAVLLQVRDAMPRQQLVVDEEVARRGLRVAGEHQIGC